MDALLRDWYVRCVGEDAADAISEAMRNDPGLDRGHMRRAVFKLQGGDSDGAIADFRRLNCHLSLRGFLGE